MYETQLLEESDWVNITYMRVICMVAKHGERVTITFSVVILDKLF